MVATKGYQKLTPEERARQQANQERLEQVIARRLERERDNPGGDPASSRPDSHANCFPGGTSDASI